ncbi:HNH endonuclease [Massilia arenosa]|uniref:HNH endonuclease n=1 Tax=Zemynaea arenosa TaxID=2561931 RepID=A0A4Y9S8H1_9BURK|nr:HNH endonuclease signature motif containing protein [Massilia arenosa]TFW16046.1 HNH endonuclease [Massilia arenosa]
MAKRIFSSAERYAIYTVHGEKCYMCNTPVDLEGFEVDHVIAESLENDPDLPRVLQLLGLPAEFDIQSYENWLPACGRCNNFKRNSVFSPSLLLSLQLEKANKKAEEARKLAEKKVTAQMVSRAMNTVKRALVAGRADRSAMAEFAEFINFHTENRVSEMIGKPILFEPGLELVSEQGGIRLVRGAYGVGAGPAADDVGWGMRCVCGSPYFNGSRCVRCGLMDDD